jgi:hypothetical protein
MTLPNDSLPSHDQPLDLGGGAVWRPVHTWASGACLHIDGTLEVWGRLDQPLDVAASADGDVPSDVAAAADAAWGVGKVFVWLDLDHDDATPVLVVPAGALDSVRVEEALRRWAASGTRLLPAKAGR